MGRPPHPAHSPCLRLRSLPLNISPLPEPTSTRRTRDKVVSPHAPHTLARDAIPKIFLVARARDSHPDCPSLLPSIPPSWCFSGACLSRAQTTHVLLSTAQRKVYVATSAALRASGALVVAAFVFERRRRPRRRHCTSSKLQAAPLIATVNGRTYTHRDRALGFCTGLSRDASS